MRALLRRRGLDPHGLRFTASPLGRARDTMERVRAEMGLEPAGYATDDRLRELSFGAWEGSTWPELKARHPDLVKARKRDKWTFRPPGGESYGDLAARLAPWLAAVGEGDVAVAHGGVARALLRLAGAVSEAEAPDVDIVQGRVLCLRGPRFHWA